MSDRSYHTDDVNNHTPSCFIGVSGWNCPPECGTGTIFSPLTQVSNGNGSRHSKIADVGDRPDLPPTVGDVPPIIEYPAGIITTTTTGPIEIISSTDARITGPYSKLCKVAEYLDDLSANECRTVVERMLALYPDQAIEVITEFWNEKKHG